MQKKRTHTAAVSEDVDVDGKQPSDSVDPLAPPSTAADPMKGHSERKRSKLAVSSPKQTPDPQCDTEAAATPAVVSPAPKATAAAVDSQRSKLAASGANQSSTEVETTPPVVSTRRQYLTRSRVAVTSDGVPIAKHKLKGPAIVLMSMSSSGTPS
jgi:hypothetical protein